MTLDIEVRYAGPAIDVARRLREALADHLMGRLVATPRPGRYGLVLCVTAESGGIAHARAVTMVKSVINDMRRAGVTTWQVAAVPAPASPAEAADGDQCRPNGDTGGRLPWFKHRPRVAAEPFGRARSDHVPL